MDELIRRSDAIREMALMLEDISTDLCEDILTRFGYDTPQELATEAMSVIPSADRPQGEWIPCTEREPNEFEDVLVLLSDGTMDVLQITDYLDIWGNVKWCHAVNYGMGYAVGNNDVVAWMPLPEPWKGAKNNKECHKPQSLYYRAFCEEREDSTYCNGCEFWY